MALIKRNQRKIVNNGGKKSNSLELHRTTLASIESLSIPLVQEVVFLADFRCARCQQRIAEIMSKMNGEMQSVVVSMLEKKVTLTTSTYPNKPTPRGLIASIQWIPLNKIALKMRLMFPSCS